MTPSNSPHISEDDHLAGDEGVVVVYTRPWEYDPNTDPKATLIAKVLDAVRTVVEDEKGLGEKAGERLKALAKRTQWAKAIALAANTAITFSPPSFDKVVELFGKRRKGRPSRRCRASATSSPR
jgi:hypothetical protein